MNPHSKPTGDNRERLKEDIAQPKRGDTSLGETLKIAQERLQLEQQKEEHTHQRTMSEAEQKHCRDMREKDLGRIGRLLGNERSAPTSLAFLTACIGFFIIFGGSILEACCPQEASIWGKLIDGGLTLLSSSIAYVFGRSSNK